MIVVFMNGAIRLGSFTTINPVISKAATAAAEITNMIEWVIQVDC